RPTLLHPLFQAGQRTESRRLAFAEISEDEPVRFMRRIGGEFLHPVAERIRLGRLLNAASALVEAPAVIAAADGFAFDPADVQAGQAMRAFIADDMRLAAFAAI